jgi:hypothetical protein
MGKGPTHGRLPSRDKAELGGFCHQGLPIGRLPPPLHTPQAGAARGLGHPTRLVTYVLAAEDSTTVSSRSPKASAVSSGGLLCCSVSSVAATPRHPIPRRGAGAWPFRGLHWCDVILVAAPGRWRDTTPENPFIKHHRMVQPCQPTCCVRSFHLGVPSNAQSQAPRPRRPSPTTGPPPLPRASSVQHSTAGSLNRRWISVSLGVMTPSTGTAWDCLSCHVLCVERLPIIVPSAFYLTTGPA